MFRGLLDLARIDAGTLQAQRVSVPLPALCERFGHGRDLLQVAPHAGYADDTVPGLGPACHGHGRARHDELREVTSSNAEGTDGWGEVRFTPTRSAQRPRATVAAGVQHGNSWPPLHWPAWPYSVYW